MLSKLNFEYVGAKGGLWVRALKKTKSTKPPRKISWAKRTQKKQNFSLQTPHNDLQLSKALFEEKCGECKKKKCGKSMHQCTTHSARCFLLTVTVGDRVGKCEK